MPSLPRHDPLNIIATHEQINARHRELEASPVDVFGQLIDCDERSEMRMTNTIEHWDDLELQPGVIEEVDLEGETVRVVLWTMGDNSISALSFPVLTMARDEMLKQRARRGPILFSALRAFKANPATTLRDIESPASWGI